MPHSDSDSDDEKSPSTRSRTLNESVYGGWKSDTQMALESKRLFSYVTGVRRRPAARPAAVGGPEDAASATAREEAENKIVQWTDRDAQAKALIGRRLPYDHRHLVTAAETSKELWDSIVHKYERGRSGASIAATITEVVNKRYVDGSYEKHISWFRETNELLARFEHADDPTDYNHFSQRVLACLLVNSLPSVGDWGSVKASIFANFSGKISFEQVAALIMGEAHRLKLEEKSRQVATAAPAAAHYSSGHADAGTTATQSSSRSGERQDDRPTCSHCGKRGHRKANCWTLHPAMLPDDIKQRGQRGRQPNRVSSRDSKKASKKSSRKEGESSRKEGERASRAQRDSDDDEASDSSGNWASCAVLVDDDDASDDAGAELAVPATPAAALTPSSMHASGADEEKVTVHSTGIKGRSLASDWLVDSGASLHYCHQRDMFDTFKPVTGKGRSVLLGDGRRIPVVGCGTLKVSVPVFGGLSAGTLTNVQYTPDMAVNLLSVPSLTETGLEVRFLDRDCTIRRGRKVIARARKVANKLFQLTALKRERPAAQGGASQGGSAHVAQTDLAQLWHQRLGHLNYPALKQLFAEEQVRFERGVDCERIARAVRDPAQSSKCETCILAKSARKAFPTEGATRARRPLELVHMDLCSMPTLSQSGAKYFLTIKDDATHELWAVLLKHKNEALPSYKAWVTAVEAKHSAAGHKVAAVRSDNGGEFISRDFDALLAERGSIRERTAAHTPQQNGVAERVNRTLLNSIRAMLHDGQLDDSFWDEALRTAVHIHNRVPTRALNGKTPHEAWTGNKPRVGHMRVFGSLAYAHLPKQGRNKLALRARKCVFVGYAQDAKAYRLWDIKANKIVVSRDVDFWEGVSWTSEAAGRGGAVPVAPETKLTGQSSSSTRRTNPHRAVRGDVDSTESDTSDSDTDPDSEAASDDSKPEPVAPQPAAPDLAADEHVDADEKEPAEEADEKERAEVVEEKEPVERVEQPVAAQPRRRGRIAKSDPRYMPADLAALRDKNSSAAKDIAPSMVPPRAFTGATSDDVERVPRSYKEAMRGPHGPEWHGKCQDEWDQQLKKGTHILVPRPDKHVNIVGNRWVLEVKYNAEGQLVKRRARLVAQGFSQRHGVDYFDTYAPVVRYPSLRALFSLAAQHDWEVHHMDVKSAFLNADLEETVYMRQPEGFVVKGKEDWVCLLKKGLYGLRQGSRVWNLKADTLLRKKLGFTRLDADRCVYVWKRDGKWMIVTLYVDDMFLFAERGSDLLPKLKARLKREFEMTDLGEVKEALGMEVARDRKARTLTITQRRHVKGILERAGMTDCSPVTTPLAVGTQLCLPEEGFKATAADTLRYQKALGELNYLVSWARPDIAFAVSALSKYCSNPSPQHFAGLRHVHRYLRGTQDHGVTYRGTGDRTEVPKLTIYSDADFAACKDDRRSVTGYSVHLGSAAVSWSSTRQKTTAQSTVEAEYMSSAEAVKEAVWWRAFLRGLGHKVDSPTVLYSDNQGSIALSKNPDSHRRTKHIDVKYHLLREHVEKGTVALQYISTKDMPADMLTKGLPPLKHNQCAELLGMGA
jgi:transposase InsO family protein